MGSEEEMKRKQKKVWSSSPLCEMLRETEREREREKKRRENEGGHKSSDTGLFQMFGRKERFTSLVRQ